MQESTRTITELRDEVKKARSDAEKGKRRAHSADRHRDASDATPAAAATEQKSPERRLPLEPKVVVTNKPPNGDRQDRKEAQAAPRVDPRSSGSSEGGTYNVNEHE